MSTPQLYSVVQEAFTSAKSKSLYDRVEKFIQRNPQHLGLIQDIAEYIVHLKQQTRSPYNSQIVIDKAATKKRKLDDEDNDHNENGFCFDPSRVVYTAKDTSFSVPQRKKLKLQFFRAEDHIAEGGIAAVNSTTGATEFAVAWSAVDQIVCLPVPDKAQRQHNFIVFSKDDVSTPDGTPAREPIMWTMPQTPAKTVEVGPDWASGAALEDLTYTDITTKVLDHHLTGYGKKVVFPDEKEFASAVAQAHRKGEKAVHVKAFRGSKDGYLFFLPVGITWGFKKPLALFSFSNIHSISYSSVLARTFNLIITITPSSSSSSSSVAPQTTEDIEFSMLDQADFAGIDAYVRRHRLHDASMADQRRAKKFNINGTSNTIDGKTGDVDGGTTGGDGVEESELAKAERLLQDDEDELEEDYDPGSEGESEGSGTSDEEGGDEYGDGEAGHGAKGSDSLKGELGIDAEELVKKGNP